MGVSRRAMGRFIGDQGRRDLEMNHRRLELSSRGSSACPFRYSSTLNVWRKQINISNDLIPRRCRRGLILKTEGIKALIWTNRKMS